MSTGTIYSARCVRCGAYHHRAGAPIRDGESVRHDRAYVDSQGLTRHASCDGVAVDIMGRTQEELTTILAMRYVPPDTWYPTDAQRPPHCYWGDRGPVPCAAHVRSGPGGTMAVACPPEPCTDGSLGLGWPSESE